MLIDFSVFYRKKRYVQVDLEHTKLNRVLSLIDLTALGVSCTLGSGIYVLVGDVVVNYAGPAIIISFLIAGIASFLAGLSYAELGARVIIQFSRLSTDNKILLDYQNLIGEFIAFLIGWDIILEYVIGTSSTASAMSQYIDSLCGNQIQNYLKKTVPMHADMLGSYPDFLAFGITMCITVLLVIGVKESSLLNKIFTLLNLVVILFIIICGAVKATGRNWSLTAADLQNASWIDSDNNTATCDEDTCGTGGFAPFGFNGIIKGAAKCFYAFIGFDAIATTGEEVQNPKRSIPLSIIFTLLTVAISYCITSAIITLMIPYYLLDPNSPFAAAFDYVGFHWATYIVVIGAIASLATCMYASMFPMPRVVYSMGTDGLIFTFFSYVLPKLKTPVWAALATGLFAAFMALLFDLNQLIEMMSIGTLLAYSLVSACVIVLRYRPIDEDEQQAISLQPIISSGHNQNSAAQLLANQESSTQLYQEEPLSENQDPYVQQNPTKTKTKTLKFGELYSKICVPCQKKCSKQKFQVQTDMPINTKPDNILKNLFAPSNKKCNKTAALIVNILTVCAVLDIIALALFFSKLEDLSKPYAIFLITFCLLILVMLTIMIFLQPQNDKITTFKVPLVPFLPMIAIFVNVYLMMLLTFNTWMRFLVWFCIGLVMYMFYGARNSKENKLPKSVFFPYIKKCPKCKRKIRADNDAPPAYPGQNPVELVNTEANGSNEGKMD